MDICNLHAAALRDMGLPQENPLVACSARLIVDKELGLCFGTGF
jgi:hypothetical protein